MKSRTTYRPFRKPLLSCAALLTRVIFCCRPLSYFVSKSTRWDADGLTLLSTANISQRRTTMSDPGGMQPMMAFDKNPPPPGDEYEEIREQVSSEKFSLTDLID